MKRLSLFLLAIVFLTGCLGLQTTEQEFAVKKLARIAGITYALEAPEDVDNALSYLAYIDSLGNKELKETAIDVAVKYAYDKYGKTSRTVILVAEVVDLLKIVIPDTGAVEIDMKMLDVAVAGFKEGILLAK